MEAFLRYHHLEVLGAQGNGFVRASTMRGWGEKLIKVYCVFMKQKFIRCTRHYPGTILQFFSPEHPNDTLDEVVRDTKEQLDLYRQQPCRTPCRASTLLAIWKE